MADLATLDEFKAHLGDNASTLPADAVLQGILDGVESALEGECNRGHRPFSPALDARIEIQAATGTSTLCLDYPIEDLVEVVLGYDSENPDETLDVDDPLVLTWEGTRLMRLDGGVFGRRVGLPFVRVTYDTKEDLPDDAKLAVLDVAASMLRQVGKEGLRSYTEGPYSETYATWADSSPLWKRAVDAHREVLV